MDWIWLWKKNIYIPIFNKTSDWMYAICILKPYHLLKILYSNTILKCLQHQEGFRSDLTGTSIEALRQEVNLFDGGDLEGHLHDPEQWAAVQGPDVQEARLASCYQ